MKYKFNSRICTSREQGERLLKLGLSKTTADMSHTMQVVLDKTFDLISEDVWKEDYPASQFHFPAWSLHRLVMLMPKCVRAHSDYDDSPRLHPYVPKFDYQGVTIENTDEILADFYEHTDLFDNIIDCIEWLIKEGHFSKEYLI